MLRNSLLASLALFPVLVLAAPEPTPPPPEALMVSTPPAGGNVVNMEDIQAQTMLYKAQFLRDKALVDLQKLGSDGDSRTLASAPLPYDTSASQSAAPTAPSKDDTPPQVIQITGSGKTVSALIRTSGGNQLMVQAGNDIPGTNLKVEKVTFDAVTVSKPGKQPWILAFAED